jgi:BirA family biotin operon repressor/biotin-[acetyl-CoA-carboxylase] ligase
MPRLGSAIIHYETVTSTNDIARDLALKKAPEGTVVIAGNQTAGRGRLGRRWESPSDGGLYLSVILRPQVSPSASTIITLACAVAVANTLINEFDVAADIKWPNDVLASGRKICGILVEAAIEAGEVQHVVAGIGVNLNQREFPFSIGENATSLFLETGRLVTPREFTQFLLKELDEQYNAALRHPSRIIKEWESLSTYARGRAVTITSGDETVSGTTAGVTEAGALILELDGGERREILSGEVTLRLSAS